MAVSEKQRFGRLLTLEPAGLRGGRIVWLCQCDCGNQCRVSSKHLQSGGTKSCGCWRSEKIARMRTQSAASFESRLAKMPSGCIEWTGSRDRGGYGTLRSGKRDHKAHRVAYEKAYGPIPKGRLVCHTCDNPPCCNPEHLFLGTPKDNKVDSVNKGRHAYGVRSGCSKLNDHTVRQIRRLYGEGYSQQKIAEMFGVHQATVSRIVLRQSWTHPLKKEKRT